MASPRDIPRLPLAPVPPGRLQVQKQRSKKKSSFLAGSPSKERAPIENWGDIQLDQSLFPPTHPLPPPPVSNTPQANYSFDSIDTLDLMIRPLTIVKSEPGLQRSDSTETLKPRHPRDLIQARSSLDHLKTRPFFGVPIRPNFAQKRNVTVPGKLPSQAQKKSSFIGRVNSLSRQFGKSFTPKSSGSKGKIRAVTSSINLLGGYDGSRSRAESVYDDSIAMGSYPHSHGDDEPEVGSDELLYAATDAGSVASDFSFNRAGPARERKKSVVSSIFSPTSSAFSLVRRAASTSAADLVRKQSHPGLIESEKSKFKKMKRTASLLTDEENSTSSPSSIFGIGGAKKAISKLIDDVVHPGSDKKAEKRKKAEANSIFSNTSGEPQEELATSSRQFNPERSQLSQISSSKATTPYYYPEIGLQSRLGQRKPPFLCLDLSVISDVKATDVTTERESWAVVEVRGKVRMGEKAKVAQGLEVLLLLDLCSCTSPSSFTSLINTTQSILSRLSDRTNDLIAIAGFNNDTQLLLGSEPATESAKETVSYILKELQEQRKGEFYTHHRDVVGFLQGALAYFSEDPHQLQTPKSRHLILLSSAFGEKDVDRPVSMRGFEDVRIHVIGIGCLFWPSGAQLSRSIPVGGWNFPTSPMDVSIPNYTQTKPVREIKSFIRCLRTTTDLGELKDVSICITPGEHTAIKAVIGHTNLKVLRPGERSTLLLRLKICQGESGSANSTSPGGTPLSGIGDLDRDLRATLGDLKSPLVKIHAFYNHSLLPRSTYLSTVADAEVTRFRKDSIWVSGEPDVVSPQISKVVSSTYTGNDYVRKALMQKVVSEQRNPRRALAAVEDIAGSTDAKNLDYVDIVRELRYQILLSDSKRSGKRSRVATKEILALRQASGTPEASEIKRLLNERAGSATPQQPSETEDSLRSEESNIFSDSTCSSELAVTMSPREPRKARSIDTAGRLWNELEGEHIQSRRLGTDSPQSLGTLRDVTEVEFSPWAI